MSKPRTLKKRKKTFIVIGKYGREEVKMAVEDIIYFDSILS